jgi:hypothetical protein
MTNRQKRVRRPALFELRKEVANTEHWAAAAAEDPYLGLG